MKTMLLAACAALAVMSSASIASAQQVNLPTLGVIGGVGAVGGLTGSQGFSNGEVTAWKSPGLDGNGTVSAKFDSYGLAESGIRGDVTSGYNGTGENGFGASLNVASGALSQTGASLTAPGSATAQSSSFGSGSTGTIGGGIGIGIGIGGR